MHDITRLGESRRWSDVVIHLGVARWVEVADDMTAGTESQIRQVLAQIDATIERLGGTRRDLLQIVIYLADLVDAPLLNAQWDAWVPAGHAPVRACVQAGLSGSCRVEMVIVAAVEDATA